MRKLLGMYSALFALAVIIVGCGGGNSGSSDTLAGGSDFSGDSQLLNFGSLITRIAGTVQPPVTAGEAGVVVTGVAGGTVSSLILRDTAGNLGETRIAFHSERDGNAEIYSMNTDGTGLSRLTNHPAFDSAPAPSPDGNKIAFVSNRDGDNEIFVMNTDGTGLMQLTSNSVSDHNPAWSPDGTKIVFDSDRDNNREIYTMNADGSAQTRRTFHSSVDGDPAWSPDGTQVAFFSDRTGDREIYVMNVDGSGLLRLTNNTSVDSAPCWSPDNTKIAFHSNREGTWDIYTINRDGSNLKRLTSSSGTNEDPSWSPDGSRIAFHSNRSGDYDIYAMNVDGSAVHPLTTTHGNDLLPYWGSFATRRTLLGKGGLLGTTAAGFLFAQQGDLVQSVVAFNATSQASARVLAQTPSGTGLPNVVFTLSADSLIALSFISGASPAPVNVIGASGEATIATGAVVSFNATSGQVAAVLPYTANRAAGSGVPAITTANGVQIMHGKFLGAWDGSGKNHAPNGASEARLDAGSGKILAVK